MMKKIEKAYKDRHPAARESGVTCLTCKQHVDWLVDLENGDRTGVCGCPRTMWIEDKDSIYRCSSEK